MKHGADVELASKTGFTPLMFAAQQGDADSGRILLRAGAKPNDAQPKSGLTPLMIASAMGNAKAVDLLLDNGADPNAVDANGYAPLHTAVRDSDYGIDLERRDAILTIVKSLLKHGANPNLRIKQDKAKAAAEIKARRQRLLREAHRRHRHGNRSPGRHAARAGRGSQQP